MFRTDIEVHSLTMLHKGSKLVEVQVFQLKKKTLYCNVVHLLVLS